VLSVAATLFLGLLSGSLIMEALVFVPFWRTLNPDEFFALHHKFGPRLFLYFAPLTTAAVALPLLSAALSRHGQHAMQRWAVASLALTVSASFPLFFRKANDAFANRTFPNDALPAELQRWARVHTARTIVASVAFLLSALI
jgi:Domain of unknown function (DUF1772)